MTASTSRMLQATARVMRRPSRLDSRLLSTGATIPRHGRAAAEPDGSAARGVGGWLGIGNEMALARHSCGVPADHRGER
jgi:hypothetical protein